MNSRDTVVPLQQEVGHTVGTNRRKGKEQDKGREGRRTLGGTHLMNVFLGVESRSLSVHDR